MLRCNGQRLPQRQQERRLPGGAVLPEPQGEAGDAGAGERDLGGVPAVGEANGDTIDLISEQKLGGVPALTDGLQIQPCLAGAVLCQLFQQDTGTQHGFRRSGDLLLCGDFQRSICSAAVGDLPGGTDVKGAIGFDLGDDLRAVGLRIALPRVDVEAESRQQPVRAGDG